MEEQHDVWLGETDVKMSPLLQSQASAMSTQKALAQAKAQIGGFMDSFKEKAAGVMMGMVAENEGALLHLTFTGWADYMRRQKAEEEIHAEYQAKLEEAQKRLMEYKDQQLNNVRNMMMAGLKDAQMALVGACFAALLDEAAHNKCIKTTVKEVEELQANLRSFAEGAASKAKSVMARMNEGNDEALKAMSFKAWIDYMQIEKQEKEVNASLKASQDKVNEMMMKQSGGAKNTLMRMFAGNDSALLVSCIKGWKEVIIEERQSAEMEAALNAKSSALNGFSSRNKGSAMSASERSAALQDEETMLYIFLFWKRETRVERTRRHGKEKNERRKKDLIGVKGLFRTFANDLESSLRQGTPRIEAPKRPS